MISHDLTREEIFSLWAEDLLNSVGETVEVGVGIGSNSSKFVWFAKPAKHYGIDPYEIYEGYDEVFSHEWESQETLDAMYLQVANEFSTHDSAELFRMTGAAGSLHFSDDSLDVVILDADHSYACYTQDIATWWPKVHSQGFLAGHGYDSPAEWGFGVKEAVDEFVAARSLELNVNSDSTWWVRKP